MDVLVITCLMWYRNYGKLPTWKLHMNAPTSRHYEWETEIIVIPEFPSWSDQNLFNMAEKRTYSVMGGM